MGSFSGKTTDEVKANNNSINDQNTSLSTVHKDVKSIDMNNASEESSYDFFGRIFRCCGVRSKDDVEDIPYDERELKIKEKLEQLRKRKLEKDQRNKGTLNCMKEEEEDIQFNSKVLSSPNKINNKESPTASSNNNNNLIVINGKEDSTLIKKEPESK